MGLFGSTPAASAPQDRIDIDQLTRRVAALEATVQRLQVELATTSGIAQDPTAGVAGAVAGTVTGTVEPMFMAEVRGLAAQGKKINAIKVYREHTGAGLKEAKDAVERLY